MTFDTLLSQINFFLPSATLAKGPSAVDYVAAFQHHTVGRQFAEVQFEGNAVTGITGLSDDLLHKEGIALAGAGLMGISITAAFVQKGIPVLLFDIQPDALVSAPDRLAHELALQLPDRQNEIGSLIENYFRTTESLEEVGGKRVLVETIYEKLKVKQKFYRQLDSCCRPEMLLLSNTSTIRIGSLAEVFAGHCRNLSAARFSGFHFFHPVRKRTLLEVIRGPETLESTTIAAIQLARMIEKTPIVVHDGPGFLVNRLLNPYLNEALVLLEEGVAIDRIENVCRRFGMEMGPFRIMDEIGLDVTLHSGWSIRQELPYAVTADRILPALIADRRLGRKNGRGFRLYQSTKAQWEDAGSFDPSLPDLIQAALSPNEPAGSLSDTDLSDEMIAARMFLPVYLEAGRIVEAGIVDSLTLTDAALVLGLGFPPDKGGICYWAESVGRENLVTLAELLSPLGDRYQVPDLFRR